MIFTNISFVQEIESEVDHYIQIIYTFSNPNNSVSLNYLFTS